MHSIMKSNGLIILILIITGSSFILAADETQITAIAPKVAYLNSETSLTVIAQNTIDLSPVQTDISGYLQTEDRPLLFSGQTDSAGRLTAAFTLTALPPGNYSVAIASNAISEPVTFSLQLKDRPIIMIETDKPIYKPGQTIQGRILALSSNLKPRQDQVDLSITDGKGIKIYHRDLETNDYGIAPFELPLATELNMGTWKISANSGSAQGMLDLKVETYVLPRFEAFLELPRDYCPG